MVGRSRIVSATVNAPISINELMQDPAVRADPYTAYAEIQRMGRVVPTLYGGYVVSHHADAFMVLRDANFSSNARHQANHEQFVEMARQLGLGDLQDLF